MGRLDGKVGIVTGGASGIGEASVLLFAKEGARVLIADILDDEGRNLANTCGKDVIFQHTDVSIEADVKSVIERSMKEYGRLDCMFNNAWGTCPSGPIDNTNTKDFDNAIAVNLRGVFFGIKHAAAVMKTQGSGSIINTSSIAGLSPGWGAPIYNTCKAAINHLTWSVAIQLGKFNVRVNSICPGLIVTPIFARSIGLPSGMTIEKSMESLKEVFKSYQAIPRAGLPLDIARTALWLATEESSFVTGTSIKVDGGAIHGYFTEEKMAPIFKALGLNPHSIDYTFLG